MGISVKLQVFEGPLDLLLHLIEKNKVNIYDIPIVTITEQYLECIREMKQQDLNIMSEFLAVSYTHLDVYKRQQNMNVNETFQKLSALFHLRTESWLEVDFSRWGQKESDNEKFSSDFFGKNRKRRKKITVSLRCCFQKKWHTIGTQVDILFPAYLKEIAAEQAKLIYEKNKT